MKDQPGLAVRIATAEKWVHRVVHAPEIAMRPDGPGRGFLLARSVEPALSETGRVSSHLVETVTQLAAQVVPAIGGPSVLDVRFGHRAIPADGLPALGKASQIDGYYEAVMHSGITLGPIAARTLTAEILHGDVDPLAASFRASRLASA
jgi:glycine/D-amino acid oxidase-like deaminating enzyme